MEKKWNGEDNRGNNMVMRIINIHTKEKLNTRYRDWKISILDKHLEDNWRIEYLPDLVDVFEVNTKSGEKKFIETTDRSFAKDTYLKNNKNYTISNTDIKRFDKKLREFNNPHKLEAIQINQSLLGFLRLKSGIITNIKKNALANAMTISSHVKSIIITVIGGIIILIIWAIYGNQLTDFFNGILP